MRKLLALTAVVLIVALFWSGTGWFGRSDELNAVIVFDRPEGLRAGDRVVQDGTPIGEVRKVSTVDGRPAVTIRVPEEHRSALRSDSLVRVVRGGSRPQLEVDSNFAVGRPLEDGAVLRARDHDLARWLDKGKDAVTPAARRMRDSAVAWIERTGTEKIDREIDDWTRRIPEWKQEGREAFAAHVAAARKTSEEWEASLRSAGRKADADRVRQRVDEWLDALKSEGNE